MMKCNICKKEITTKDKRRITCSKKCSRLRQDENAKKCREKPEAKEVMKRYQGEYNKRPEVKEKKRKYYQRPEVKERMRKYYQRPEVKEKAKERLRKLRLRDKI